MLYLAATPIGNLEDLTLRIIRVFKEADLVLAEDTRKTGLLLHHLGLKKSLMSFFDHNETQKTPQIVAELKQGKNIVLVTDAGAPTISDPGYKLVRACRQENIPVTALPGPSSVITALALTGIPHDKFVFLGYLPRKDGERARLLESLKEFPGAAVFFESPYRLVKSLESVKEVLGNIKVAVCRELTKKFEEVIEHPVEQVIAHFQSQAPKGEITVVADLKRKD